MKGKKKIEKIKIKNKIKAWVFDSIFSLLRQTSSYFERCEIFLSCTSARQKVACVLPANA